MNKRKRVRENETEGRTLIHCMRTIDSYKKAEREKKNKEKTRDQWREQGVSLVRSISMMDKYIKHCSHDSLLDTKKFVEKEWNKAFTNEKNWRTKKHYGIRHQWIFVWLWEFYNNFNFLFCMWIDNKRPISQKILFELTTKINKHFVFFSYRKRFKRWKK